MPDSPDDTPFSPSTESPIQLRRDLEITTIRRGLNVSYVVKDPVNLKYFEFDEHEIALVNQLDGNKSWKEICQWFNHRFPPLRLNHHSLQSLIWRLGQQDLLLSTKPRQGRRLAKKSIQRQRQKWTDRLAQPWIIRLPGFDPSPWMGLINGCLGWAFSPVFAGLASIGILLLLGFLTAQHFVVDLRTDSSVFFTPQNLCLFALVIIMTKMIHELGHAVVAYRNGCECHEMGILLLAGLPSLYCDVSDAWILPDQIKRISVSLAGIWLEMLVAASAFIIWYASVPGIVHAISFNVMVVCTMGTLLFNANPLVRYDGYYVLMDLVGISNLAQRSSEVLDQFLSRWILGRVELRPLDESELPGWCLLYGAASLVYRVFLTFAIVWGLHLALKPFSASFIVWGLAAISFTLWSIKMLRENTTRIRRTIAVGTPVWRVALGITLTGTALISCACIPLPWHVMGQAVMQPADQQTIVATVPGQLIEREDAGKSIEQNATIAQLRNHDVDAEIHRVESDLRVQNQRMQSLLVRRSDDVRAAEQIPGARAQQAALTERLDFLREEQQRLNLRGRQKAIIYRAANRQDETDRRQLPNWSGSLLDDVNRNAWVHSGDQLCQMGTLQQMNAIAILAQDDMKSVSVGQQVSILLKSSGKSLAGEVSQISNAELNVFDDPTIAALLPTGTDLRPGHSPHGKWYQVQIRCRSQVPDGTPIRSRSVVRIHTGSRTVGEWIAEQFFRTFRWHA